MSKLLIQLKNNLFLDEYLEIFDWLLSGDFFDEKSGWNKKYVTKYTKQIKKNLSIKEDDLIHGKNAKLNYRQMPTKIVINMKSGNGFARDFIRHIRNSFAHGNMKLQNRKGTYFLEIKDFSTDKAQNAYIVLPLESLKAVFKIYKNIEKGI